MGCRGSSCNCSSIREREGGIIGDKEGTVKSSQTLTQLPYQGVEFNNNRSPNCRRHHNCLCTYRSRVQQLHKAQLQMRPQLPPQPTGAELNTNYQLHDCVKAIAPLKEVPAVTQKQPQRYFFFQCIPKHWTEKKNFLVLSLFYLVIFIFLTLSLSFFLSHWDQRRVGTKIYNFGAQLVRH